MKKYIILIICGFCFSLIFGIIADVYDIDYRNNLLGFIVAVVTFTPITIGLLLISKNIQQHRNIASKVLKFIAIFIIVAGILSTIIVLFGKSNNDTENDHLAILQSPSFSVDTIEAQVKVTDTLYIYHKDGYITKTVFIEQNILDHGDYEKFTTYANYTNELYQLEQLQMKGYEYSSTLIDKSFTWKITHDYSEIDVKEELDNAKQFQHLESFINENYQIPYKQVIDAYKEIGWECKEVR